MKYKYIYMYDVSYEYQVCTERKMCMYCCTSISHELTLDTHSANCPSEEMTTSDTKWEWPVSERWG